MTKISQTSRLATALTGALTGVLIVAGFAHATAQTRPSHLDTVLRQMDEASQKFQSAQADLQKDQYEKLVKDTTTETGKIYFLHKGSTIQMGARTGSHIAEYKDGKVRLYVPSSNHLDEFATTGKNQATAEAVLTLGFGGSGKDLQKGWAITDLGTEQMTDGTKSVEVEKLDLVSKDPQMKSNFTHVTIWIDPVRDVALKQIFYENSGNTNTATYTNIQLNKPIDFSYFAIKCKGKCG